MFSRLNTIHGGEQWSDLVNQHLGQVMNELRLGPFDTSDLVGSLDLHDTNEAYVLVVDVPGFSSNDVHVSLKGRKLRINAQANASSSANSSKVLLRERGKRSVDRSVIMPKAVRESEIHACVSDGVLTVTLPKRVDESPREIQVH